MSEVYRETHRRVEALIAAKSVKRQPIGFLANLMSASKCSFCSTGDYKLICAVSLQFRFQGPRTMRNLAQATLLYLTMIHV